MATVEELYTQLLGRAPDAGGLAYWQSQFGGSVDPSEQATFLNAAQAELANRTPAEQVQLAPNLVAQAAAAPAVSTPLTPSGLLDWKSQIFSSLDTAKAGAPKQLEFTPIKTEMLGFGDGEYQSTTGGELKTQGVEAETIGGGDSDPIITGYISKTPTTVNGLSVYAHYDTNGKLDYYGAPEATWLDDKTTARGMWNPDGSVRLNVQASGGGAFSDITSGFDDIVTQNPALRAAAIAYALGPPTPTGAEAGATTTAGANTGGSTMLDYSAPTSTGGLGLQGTAALDGTLASGLAAPAGGSLGGGLGLTAGAAGNIAAMGGAQGLLANAAGGGVLSAGGVNTGLFTAANLASTLAGGGAAASTLTDTLKNLTPTQVTQLAKAGISVAGLLGGAAAAGGLVGGGSGGNLSLNPQDRSGVSSGSAQYSPEYYQAIQAKYNQMMPQQPRDVTTDLKSWYETKYAPTAPTAQKVI